MRLRDARAKLENEVADARAKWLDAKRAEEMARAHYEALERILMTTFGGPSKRKARKSAPESGS